MANELLKNSNAYKCYCSNKEIEEQKKRAKQKKLPYIYNRKCRDISEKDVPKDNITKTEIDRIKTKFN